VDIVVGQALEYLDILVHLDSVFLVIPDILVSRAGQDDLVGRDIQGSLVFLVLQDSGDKMAQAVIQDTVVIRASRVIQVTANRVTQVIRVLEPLVFLAVQDGRDIQE
jgi:hypothetical protein